MAFPYLLAALTLSAILTPIIGKGIWPPIIAMVTFGWMGYSRIIRGDILSVRERDYVMASRVIGVKDRRIIMKHVIPNAIYPRNLALDQYPGGRDRLFGTSFLDRHR
jgi:peptide/nickel transport system permease protein